MRAVIQSSKQLERIQVLSNRLRELRSLPVATLTKRPSAKKWSVLEVIKHMEIAHDAYRDKVRKVINNSELSGKGIVTLTCSAIPSFLIKRFPPQNKKIRFKMKTAGKFKPMLNGGEDAKIIFEAFEMTLKDLEGWVKQYQVKGVSPEKFNSAVGPLVRFNVPEAVEFILCHNERHFQQIENTLKAL
jgi:hypothetical protein